MNHNYSKIYTTELTFLLAHCRINTSAGTVRRHWSNFSDLVALPHATSLARAQACLLANPGSNTVFRGWPLCEIALWNRPTTEYNLIVTVNYRWKALLMYGWKMLTFGHGGYEMQSHIDSACTASWNGHVGWITSEWFNMMLNPLQNHYLIFQTVVTWNYVIFDAEKTLTDQSRYKWWVEVCSRIWVSVDCVRYLVDLFCKS